MIVLSSDGGVVFVGGTGVSGVVGFVGFLMIPWRSESPENDPSEQPVIFLL
jgi:hypothetical protein